MIHHQVVVIDMSEAEPGRRERGGRPSLLTRTTSKIICDGVRHGLYPTRAAALAGIANSTMSRWMALGEPGPHDPGYNEKYHKFRKRIDKAEADLAAKTLQQIEQHADNGDRKAAEWVAEHRYARDYAPHSTQDTDNTHHIEQEPINKRLDKWKEVLLEVPNE
jgi:hypothetical protein